jgi:hypothetical protein
LSCSTSHSLFLFLHCLILCFFSSSYHFTLLLLSLSFFSSLSLFHSLFYLSLLVFCLQYVTHFMPYPLLLVFSASLYPSFSSVSFLSLSHLTYQTQFVGLTDKTHV